MTGPRETAVVRAGLQVLRERGAYVHAPDPAADTGVPDRHATYLGRSIFIEFKRPVGGRLSPKQRWHGERIQAAGGLWIVARSAQDVRDALDAIDKEIDT